MNRSNPRGDKAAVCQSGAVFGVRHGMPVLLETARDVHSLAQFTLSESQTVIGGSPRATLPFLHKGKIIARRRGKIR
jgi:hypothetical protein